MIKTLSYDGKNAFMFGDFMTEIIKPPRLKLGDTIGIFTPSNPAAVKYPEKYLHGLEELKRTGFKILEGSLTKNRASQGFRSGTPQERAQEFMDLYLDPKVNALMAVLGGSCSASMIPYLNFEAIKNTPKMIIGFSDVTALHLALLKHASLASVYGPMVIRTFAEWPHVLPYSLSSFLQAASKLGEEQVELSPPTEWSSTKGSWDDSEWNRQQKPFIKNSGWNVARKGSSRAPVIMANLNTLVRAAGTEYFPDLTDKILIIEEMRSTLSDLERNLRHLERIGIFKIISGLIVSKPEYFFDEGAPFSLDDLVLEVVNTTNHHFPIITQFDCGHTTPMITIEQMSIMTIVAEDESSPRIFIKY